MSKFKVGQRVRIARFSRGPDDGAHPPGLPSAIGMEATIIRIPALRPGWDCSVKVDNYPAYGYEAEVGYACMFASLEPLTEPAADAFMERLKRLGREPVNSPAKVTV